MMVTNKGVKIMFNLGKLFNKRETKKETKVEPKRATQTQEIPRLIVSQDQYDRSSERLLRGMK
jgi:hypothetical protein